MVRLRQISALIRIEHQSEHQSRTCIDLTWSLLLTAIIGDGGLGHPPGSSRLPPPPTPPHLLHSRQLLTPLTCVLPRLLSPVHQAGPAVALHLGGAALAGRHPGVHPQRLVVALVAAPVGGGRAGGVGHLTVWVVCLSSRDVHVSSAQVIW